VGKVAVPVSPSAPSVILRTSRAPSPDPCWRRHRACSPSRVAATRPLCSPLWLPRRAVPGRHHRTVVREQGRVVRRVRMALRGDRPRDWCRVLGGDPTRYGSRSARRRAGGFWISSDRYGRPRLLAASDGPVGSRGVFISRWGDDKACGLYRYGRLWVGSSPPHRAPTERLPGSLGTRVPAPAATPSPVEAGRHALPVVAPTRGFPLGDFDLADDPLRWDHYQTLSRGRRALNLTVRTIEAWCVLCGSRFATVDAVAMSHAHQQH